MLSTTLYAALGGVIIGIAAILLLAFNGRLAGISGIIYAGLTDKNNRAWRLLFILGLLLGGILAHKLLHIPVPSLDQANIFIIITAGLLVGLGVRISSGCTSGHGICGMSRLSIRSFVATITFMLTAIITVFIMQTFSR
jgi:uncharacterized protein